MATEKAPKKKVSKKAVKKSVKKAATKKSVKKAATKKASRKKAVKTAQLTHQERYMKIAEAAYLLAEQQGFKLGSEMDNWLKAEQQIDAWIDSEGIKLTK
jgi:hypothetical protein